MLNFLFVLLIFSTGFTLSVGVIAYIIFGEYIVLAFGALISASIFGILLLTAAIQAIISYIDCFIDDHLRRK